MILWIYPMPSSPKFKVRFKTCFFIFIFTSVFLGETAWLKSGLSASDQNPLRVHFVDVGYGDAILIELPDQSVFLIDAGGKGHTEKLLTHLSVCRIEHIDAAFITHPHKNHFEGFFSIAEKYPLKRVFINGDPNAEEGYRQLLDIFQKKGIAAKIIRRGSVLDNIPPGVSLAVLNPEDLSGDANDNSLVLRLSFGKTSFLFTGDTSKLKDIAARHPEIENTSAIQVPHHGKAIDDYFINAFRDRIFMVSTGKNEWGKPVSPNLKKLKGRILRTDKIGTFILESDGSKIKISKPRTP